MVVELVRGDPLSMLIQVKIEGNTNTDPNRIWVYFLEYFLPIIISYDLTWSFKYVLR